jgi:hypothetical protein
MTQLQQGDMVMHYARGAIRAVGRVEAPAIAADRPYGLPEIWQSPGWMVPVRYFDLDPDATTDVAVGPGHDGQPATVEGRPRSSQGPGPGTLGEGSSGAGSIPGTVRLWSPSAVTRRLA